MVCDCQTMKRVEKRLKGVFKKVGEWLSHLANPVMKITP